MSELFCPDDGTCHHACLPVGCFRVAFCAPLSNVYPGDRWPPDAKPVTFADNPHLPPAPADGVHAYWDGPTDIGGNHRCKLCGAYRGSSESEAPCQGRFKESGKMRSWATQTWRAERLTAIRERAFVTVIETEVVEVKPGAPGYNKGMRTFEPGVTTTVVDWCRATDWAPCDDGKAHVYGVCSKRGHLVEESHQQWTSDGRLWAEWSGTSGPVPGDRCEHNVDVP